MFPLGRLVATPGALQAMDGVDPLLGVAMLRRHAKGDWGEIPPEDKLANDRAVRDGARILSAYRTPDNVKIWIITEADRSVTTILLPKEY